MCGRSGRCRRGVNRSRASDDDPLLIREVARFAGSSWRMYGRLIPPTRQNPILSTHFRSNGTGKPLILGFIFRGSGSLAPGNRVVAAPFDFSNLRTKTAQVIVRRDAARL